MDALADFQEKVESEIVEITHESLTKLRSLWQETYEPQMAQDNINVMVRHVQCFFDEIIQETISKKTVIVADIEKLHDEASTIRRLLNVDFQLSPKKGVPLHSLRGHLDESLKDLRKQLQIRKGEIYELLTEQEELCDELGEPHRELVDDPLPTAQDIDDFKTHIDSLKGEKQERTAEVLHLRRDIKLSLMTLEITLTSEADKVLVNGHALPIKKDKLVQLREMNQYFSSKCMELKASIESLRKRIVKFWDYLEVDEDTRERFAGYTEICQTTFDKLTAELERCEVEKKQNIKKIVDKIREEIVSWWNKTLKSDLEMSRFSNFTSDFYTEDLLTLHEMELEELKFFYASYENIFELIAQRQELWNRMVALEKSASDPNRFNNRGGKLLLEEKERKTIASKLPKIEAQLTDLARAYELNNNRKFTVYGEFLEDVIARDWEKRKQDKEKMMSARKMVKSTTPTPFGHSRLLTPMPSRTNLTASSSIMKNKAKTVAAKPTPAPSLKRKMGRHPEESAAKRSILKDLASPNVFVRPKVVKKPQKPVHKVIATIQNRTGKRRSSGRHRISSGKLISRGSLPRIRLNSEEVLMDSDSTSYENFESYLGERSPCRSSIMVKSPEKKTKEQLGLHIQPSTSSNVDQKSIAGPSPSPRKKTSTKNIPIIM